MLAPTTVYLIRARIGRSREAVPAPRRTSCPINVFPKTKKPEVFRPSGLPFLDRQTYGGEIPRACDDIQPQTTMSIPALYNLEKARRFAEKFERAAELLEP